jgi:hypothetical protein
MLELSNTFFEFGFFHEFLTLFFGVTELVVIVFRDVWRLIMACFHAQVNLRSLQIELQAQP